MNEDFIRKAVRLKFVAADKILEHLPPEAANNIRKFGNLIYESIGEHVGAAVKEAPRETKAAGKINHVPIE